MDVDADPDIWGSQSDIAGGMLKDTGTIEDGDGLWYSPNTGATNESGFTGLPAGSRVQGNGLYFSMGGYGYFWSSSESSSNYAWVRELNSFYSSVDRYGIREENGFSIRCLRD